MRSLKYALSRGVPPGSGLVRATLDTNVVVSGLLGLHVSSSTPGAIMQHALDGTFDLVVSEAILSEIERTLEKPFFRARRSDNETRAELAAFIRIAIVVVPTTTVTGIATHPEADLILSTAVSAHSDYLVSGDKMLQHVGTYQGVHLISPRDFLELLEAIDLS